jgi:glucose-6-phosphate 1-dehydrogenase
MDLLRSDALVISGISGDQRLVARSDAIEASWAVIDALQARAGDVEIYVPGSWGPAAAERVVQRYGGWHNPAVASIAATATTTTA